METKIFSLIPLFEVMFFYPALLFLIIYERLRLWEIASTCNKASPVGETVANPGTAGMLSTYKKTNILKDKVKSD